MNLDHQPLHSGSIASVLALMMMTPEYSKSTHQTAVSFPRASHHMIGEYVSVSCILSVLTCYPDVGKKPGRYIPFLMKRQISPKRYRLSFVEGPLQHGIDRV